MQNAPVWQNYCTFWAKVAIWCPVRCWISFYLLDIYILWLEVPSLTLSVWGHHWMILPEIIPHLQDWNPESLDTSVNIMTPILKVSIPVSISRLKSWKSRYQSRYQYWNLESVNTSLNIKTAIQKVSIPVSISRLESWASQCQSKHKDWFSKILISITIEKPSFAHHWFILKLMV